MKKINIRRLYYHFRHRYLNLNNVVVALAFFIAASWAWGSLSVMQRNYDLQKEVDDKQRQLQLADLQTSSLQLEQRYYNTAEYQELAARQSLGLASPGESVLILPDNSVAAKAFDTAPSTQVAVSPLKPGNLKQWIDFLFGGNRHNIQG
jgi:cell division protein FtsB